MTVLTLEQEHFLDHHLIQFELECWLWNGSLKKPSEQANAGWATGLAGRPTKGHPKIDRVECWKLRVKNKFTYQQIAPRWSLPFLGPSRGFSELVLRLPLGF